MLKGAKTLKLKRNKRIQINLNECADEIVTELKMSLSHSLAETVIKQDLAKWLWNILLMSLSKKMKNRYWYKGWYLFEIPFWNDDEVCLIYVNDKLNKEVTIYLNKKSANWSCEFCQYSPSSGEEIVYQSLKEALDSNLSSIDKFYMCQ